MTIAPDTTMVIAACPFCGSEADRVQYGPNVYCKSVVGCGAGGRSVLAWNRRTPTFPVSLVTADDVALIDVAESQLKNGTMELPMWAAVYGPFLIAIARRAAPADDALRADKYKAALELLVRGIENSESDFAARVKKKAGRLTWWSVNVLQDSLAAARCTARAALSAPTPAATKGGE